MAAISTIPTQHPAYRAPTTKPILVTSVQEVNDALFTQPHDARLQAFLARPASVLPSPDELQPAVAEIHLADDASSMSAYSTAAVEAPIVNAAPTPVTRPAAPVHSVSQTSSIKSNISTTSSRRERMSAGFKQYRKDVRATFTALNSYHAF